MQLISIFLLLSLSPTNTKAIVRFERDESKDIIFFQNILSKIQFHIFSIYNINTMYGHIMLTTTSTTQRTQHTTTARSLTSCERLK